MVADPPWRRRNTTTLALLQHLTEKSASEQKRSLKLEKVFFRAYGRFSKKETPRNERPIIGTLLKDINGHKCDLPQDCQELVLLCLKEHGMALSYEPFPELGPRIKVLLDFMEKQKPRGFTALWRDKRDSNSWYTFWAAVIFGGTSLLLALAGLAVSSAQTWASFKALGK